MERKVFRRGWNVLDVGGGQGCTGGLFILHSSLKVLQCITCFVAVVSELNHHCRVLNKKKNKGRSALILYRPSHDWAVMLLYVRYKRMTTGLWSPDVRFQHLASLSWTWPLSNHRHFKQSLVLRLALNQMWSTWLVLKWNTVVLSAGWGKLKEEKGLDGCCPMTYFPWEDYTPHPRLLWPLGWKAAPPSESQITTSRSLSLIKRKGALCKKTPHFFPKK